eukprot:UN05970
MSSSCGDESHESPSDFHTKQAEAKVLGEKMMSSTESLVETTPLLDDKTLGTEHVPGEPNNEGEEGLNGGTVRRRSESLPLSEQEIIKRKEL